MAENTKSLTLTKTKVAEVEGEHRITFVASSSNYDRDGEVVNVGTFYLPVKGGGHKLVSELPQTGAGDIDVPLLLDHDLYSVEKVIGSVRKAYYENNELIFEAGISERPIAQEMFTLLKEGHLDNAFSIQFSFSENDYDRTTKTISNAEIIEVSLVTRGANFDARILDVKSLKEKGETVEENTETTVNEEQIIDEVVAETTTEEATEVKEEVKAEETEAEIEVEKTEEKAEETETEETEPETEVDNNIKENKEKPEMEEIAKGLVKEANQKTVVATTENYIASKSAMTDYAKVIAKNGRQAKSVWAENLKSKGLTGDAIMPTSIANIYFKGWKDEEGLMSAFAGIAKNTGSVNAFTTESRALGHKKGEAKSSQTITNIRRDVKAKVIYKKLPLDLQDILDDQDGELLAFRSAELRERIIHEVIISAIVGDGREEGTPDNRTFDGTRGLFSMKADLDNSTTANSFASVVASKIANVEGDNNYDKAVKTIAGVENDGMGGRIILCATKGFIRDMKIAKDENGAYLFPLGTNFNDVLGADVYEMPAMEGCGYDCIAFKAGSYVLFGNEDFEFSDYDLDYNQDVLLREKSVAGSLQGNKVCAGYVSANASA